MSKAPIAPEDIELDLDNLPHDLSPALGDRARIGLIVLATDNTVEHEWWLLMGPLPGVAVYHARIHTEPKVTSESLKRMEGRLREATALILPEVPLDVVAYGCTSASMVIGPDQVAARVHEARPDAAVTNPFTATLEACKALGLKRIAMITPYIASINAMMKSHFEDGGLDIRTVGTFNEQNDNRAARIAPTSILDAAVALGASPDVDGVFVSCTSLRVAEVAQQAEERLGKPVLSSNIAMAWHALRLAGYDTRIDGFGRLFREH